MRETKSSHFAWGMALYLLLGGALAPAAGAAQADRARSWVRAAADAMGGVARLKGFKNVRIEGIGHRNLLEQSERPEGPWLVQYEQIVELRDVPGGRLRQTFQTRGAQGDEWSGATLVVAGGVAAVVRDGKVSAASASQAEDGEQRLALAPERVVVDALEAPDLAAGADATLQGVPHRVVSWTWKGYPARLYLNATSGLPTAVEVVRPYRYNTFWSVWGDVTTRLLYSNWALEPGGVRYPRQWDDERNGMPYRSFAVTKLDLSAAAPADAFAVPADVVAAFRAAAKTTVDMMPLGRPDRPAAELGPGIVQVPGWWNVGMVRQDDGVVILEAPISSGYSAKVIAEAQRRFPGAPIKAVVSTSDAWPHVGGLREYVARGVPVYVLDLNRPIVERLLAAPRRAEPDALARAPRGAKLEAVSGRVTIGQGANRIDLYPIRGEGGERMLMAYLPERRLLYGSDLLQRMPDGTYYSPQYVAELVDAARREKLTVDTAFAMHQGPTPWAELTGAVTKISSTK